MNCCLSLVGFWLLCVDSICYRLRAVRHEYEILGPYNYYDRTKGLIRLMKKEQKHTSSPFLVNLFSI